MSQHLTTIRLPQPCTESWNAMTPTATGRHCAACQKTVVDFTGKSDAEILTFLAQAGQHKCGRFATSQLNRPLLASAPLPTQRWRAWLVAALATWGLREGLASPTKAQEPQAYAPATPGLTNGPTLPPELATVTIRGVVLDSAAHDNLPGVTVLLKGTTIGTSTDATGHFSLKLAARQWQAAGQTLVVSMIGYHSQAVVLITADAEVPLRIGLHIDYTSITSGIVVEGEPYHSTPYPWHPRAFFRWLTQPFRRS